MTTNPSDPTTSDPTTSNQTTTILTTGGTTPTIAVPADAEHVLTIVEPTAHGDSTLDLAHDVVARGGRASVVMVITDRVDADIDGYAESENLSRTEAETQAFEQLAGYCANRIGGEVPTIVERFGWLGVDIRRHITDDVTSVAIPAGLLGKRDLARIERRLGRPVVVTPAA